VCVCVSHKLKEHKDVRMYTYKPMAFSFCNHKFTCYRILTDKNAN